MQWRRGVWFAVIVCSFFLRQSVAEELKTPVHLRAEYLDYDKNSGLIYASGHATVTSENMVLEADEIFYNVDEETVLARGHVSGTDAAQDFSGHELVYNLKTKIGELSFGKIYSYKWHITGPRMERHGAEKMYLPKGYFTTCDLEYPHYSIRAKKISVFPKKYVVCYNALLYVGDTPLFYLPVFYQSLRKKRYSLSVYAGHNSTEGDFVKVIFGYPLTEHTYGRLYLDQMEYLGLGKGFRYEYDVPDRVIGSLFYYYIHQKERRITSQDPEDSPDIPDAKRWQAAFSHWQRFDPTWIGQAYARIISDQTFNRRFNEEEWRQLNNDITSSAALTKSTNTYLFRILGERRDLWHSKKEVGIENDGYQPEYVYAPRVYLATSRLRLPWSYSRRAPLYFNIVLDTKRNYTRTQGIYFWDGNMQTTLSNRLNLSRSVSLVPQVGFIEYWRDKTAGQDLRNGLYGERLARDWSEKNDRVYRKNVWQTQYFTDVNLRTRVTNFIDVDLGHSYTNEVRTSRPFEPQHVIKNTASAAVELRVSRTVKKARESWPVQKQYPWQRKVRYRFSTDITPPVSLSLLSSELAAFRGVFAEKALLERYLDPLQMQGSYRTQLLRFRSSMDYNLLPNQLIAGTREKRFYTVEGRFSNFVNTLTLIPFEGFTITTTEEIKVYRKAPEEIKDEKTGEVTRVITDRRHFWNQRLTSQLELSLRRWTVDLKANYVKGNVAIIDDQWLADEKALAAGLPIRNEQEHKEQIPRTFATVDLQNNIGFWLTKGWKVTLHSRFNLAHNRWRILDTKLLERGATIYRDLHCWEVILSWNKYVFEEEVWLRFNLKVFPERQIGAHHSQRRSGTVLEEEWNIRRK